MKYEEAEKLLKDLKFDITEGISESHLRKMLHGFISTLEWYLPQVYKRLPAPINKVEF